MDVGRSSGVQVRRIENYYDDSHKRPELMSQSISVCMAAYNGSRYIGEQIKSILAQLGRSDELVIVDDGSSDDTPDIVAAFQAEDERIIFLRNQNNQGVLFSFERALRACRGGLVFLSDQDDLWLPGKVQSIVEVFEARSDVTLVLSDARVIDAEGRVIAESFYAMSGKFRGGMFSTLMKNRYLGCTMAFRQGLLDAALPFPSDIPMHDMWIGLVNSMYGRHYFLDTPLICYRRHGHNVSPAESLDILQIIRWRWSLIKNLANLLVKRRKIGRETVQ